jgi:hypothetical protein
MKLDPGTIYRVAGTNLHHTKTTPMIVVGGAEDIQIHVGLRGMLGSVPQSLDDIPVDSESSSQEGAFTTQNIEAIEYIGYESLSGDPDAVMLAYGLNAQIVE